MGKALKTVGVIIGAAALIATGVGALAMPALAGTTTLFGVSVGTLNTISSGLVAVGGMLDKPKSQGSAAPDEWTSNPDQPIPFLMGRMGVAGKIVQRDEFGPDNMYQGIVGILSGAGPIRGVTSFSGDKQPVTFGANGIAVSSQWQGEMWMVRRSGAQPDTALTVPVGLKLGGSSFEWSSAARLSGKACYLQVLGENSKGTAFPAGIPDPVHVAEGIFGYDPRYDDTYPGGAGPCRLGVRSTYRWIEDGGIGALNWALGLVENGQVVGGIGASIDGIDVPAFVEVANIADANGWKLAAWPDTSEDVSAVLDQLLQAAGAVRARHAGKISCVSRGAPRASVATITARDTAGDIELDTAPSLFNRLNTITPRFMSEAAGWVLTPANPVAFAQYVTDDGGKHGDQIDYRFVPLLKQAAELAAYDILDAREPFSGTIPLKAHMRHLKRGDTFDIDEPGFLMDGVKCIVLSRSYDPKTAQVRIGFRSETDSKHALALGKTTTLPAFPVLTPTDPTFVSPPLPEDWTIIVRPPAPGGGQLPGFDLTGIVSNSTATAIIVEYGSTAEGPWTQAYQGPPTVTSIPIDGLQPGATYFVAVQYQRGQNYSERCVYGPYVAPLLDPSPNAPTIANLQGQITAAFGDIFDVSELVGQTRADLEAADAQLSSTLGQTRADLEAADASLYGNIVVLDNRAGVLETQTQSLETNKASVASLNAQIVRINDVEAVNATQSLALVDLENGKVSLSEYDTLKGEVASARDGSPSLLGKIQSLKAVDLDLQQSKASVQAVSALGVRTESLEADITGLQQVTADLEARKATSEALNAQRLRINDVEAVNAAQALALVDLENGKVALSEYSTLKGEVLAAREGAPSLLGQIQSLKSVDLDLQNNKATVSSVNALTARTANTEADIIDLENALATESGARAEAIQQVTAKSETRGNTIPDSTGNRGVGWSLNGGWQVVDLGFGWGRGFKITANGTAYMLREPAGRMHWPENTDGVLSFDALMLGRTSGRLRVYVEWLNASGAAIGSPTFIYVDADRDFGLRLSQQVRSPAGTVAANFVANTEDFVGSQVAVRRLKLERGLLPATGWSDDATDQNIAASVTEQSLAIIDLENQQAIASWRKRADATGGKPTILELVSSSFGNYIALTAEQIYFGDNTVFDDATDTLRTTVGSVRYVQTWGAPFGPDNLLRWTGPSSVPEGSETKANAGANGAWVDSSGLAFTGGATLSAPFDSGALSATLIGLSAGWTTVATVASKYVAANGGYIFRADWQATLSPKSPPSGAPIYGLNWRVISTNPSGGDVRVVSSGYVTGLPDTANIAMGQPYTLVTGHVSLVGDRKLHLQLALSGTDDVTAASARNARLQGVYYT